MFIDYTVSNYRSMKGECTLSMEAYTRDRKNKESLLVDGKTTCLPSVALLGANASGKTNLLDSISFMKRMVLHSGSRSDGSLTECPRFAFCETSVRLPTFFRIRFRKGSRSYAYSFSILENNIEKESLSCDGKIIFQRNGSYVEFPNIKNEMKSELELIAKILLPDSLLLSKCAEFRIDSTKEAYDWFAKDLVFFAQNSMNMPDVLKSKEKIIRMLSVADLGISNITKVSKKHMFGKESIEFSTLKITHDIRNTDKCFTYDLNIDEESDGTKHLLSFVPYCLESLENGTTVVVDEIETHLHPAIVDYLIGLFSDPAENPRGAQLIFTSHDAAIPERVGMRRDQIWFASRNPNVGVTKLYSLLDYNVRPDLKFTANYLAGRFGAVPVIEKNRVTEPNNGQTENAE